MPWATWIMDIYNPCSQYIDKVSQDHQYCTCKWLCLFSNSFFLLLLMAEYTCKKVIYRLGVAPYALQDSWINKNDFRKSGSIIIRYKVNTKKSVVYLYTSNKNLNTISSKYKILTDISDKKCARPENYVILLIEIKEEELIDTAMFLDWETQYC